MIWKKQSVNLQSNVINRFVFLVVYLKFLQLVRLIKLVGDRLCQKGIKLMTLENTATWPLHHIPVHTHMDLTIYCFLFSRIAYALELKYLSTQHMSSR